MKSTKLAGLLFGVGIASTLMVSCGSGGSGNASTGSGASVAADFISSNKALIPLG